jgi:DNA polymerase
VVVDITLDPSLQRLTVGGKRYVGDWCRHYTDTEMPADHACDVRIVLIGEAPGRQEAEQGHPFVGKSGWHLESNLLRPVGMRRADLYITNTYPYRPADNKIETVSYSEMEHWIGKLHERIAKLADPWLLVPTGNTSLRALFDDSSMRITNYRGSVMAYRDLGGRVIKVIPTVHPAATFRMPVLTRLLEADWRRIATDSTFRDLRLPNPMVHVNEGFDRLIGLLAEQPEPLLSVDIECSKRTGELYCVGFAPSATEAFVWDARYLPTIKRLCESNFPKVLQNGMFDQYVLNHHGVQLHRYEWDLLEMDHALEPNDGGDAQGVGEEFAGGGDEQRISMHSLAVLTSLHTRQPYYKSEGKLWAGDKERLYNYCGLDCVVTREIAPVLQAKLREAGKL